VFCYWLFKKGELFMRKMLIFFLFLIVVLSVNAIGGDTSATAVQILTLPYNDAGNTSTLTNTIGNASNDAFYLINSFVQLTSVTIDLSGSDYDTYLRVYDSNMTQLWYDDDGGSGADSMLSGLTLNADTNYYICVEGYSSNNGSYTMNITSAYSGPIAYASMYPPEIDFGILDVNTNSPVEVLTLENHGEFPVTITQAPTLTGNNPDQFTMTDNNTYPLTIQIDQAIDISFIFNPTSLGHKSALLTITDDQTEEDRTVNEILLVGYSQIPDNNNTSELATELTLDIEGYETILNSDEDIDWYVFWQTAPATLNIHTQQTYESTVDIAAFLYGPFDNLGETIDEFDPLYFDDDSWIDGISPQITANVTETGFYYLRIAESTFSPLREERLETMDYALWAISDNHNPPPGMMPPFNLNFDITYQGVYLSWDSPAPASRSLVGYNISRDDVVVNESPVTSTFFEDWAENLVENQEYEYKVTAVYSAPNGESEPSNTVTVTYLSVDPPLIADDFESYDDFSTSFGDWRLIDMDEQNTLGFVMGIDFPGEGSPMAFMVFNPSATTPPLQNASAYSGEKYAASFCATTGGSDDWMITPQIQLTEDNSYISFFARSYTTQYGYEKFEIAVSNGSLNPEDFTVISGEQPIEAPLNWTPYNFSLNDYSGQLIRIAIHGVSNQRFILMIDDVMVVGPAATLHNETTPILSQSVILNANYPNPFNPVTTISFNLKEAGEIDLDIYNLKGQKVTTLAHGDYPSGSHCVVWNGTDANGMKVTSGVYFYRLQAGTYTYTKKMILMK
jgi:hypothetical protein